MNDVYNLWGRVFHVGDLIVPADGTDYIGKIIYISEKEDTVQHQCTKTGKVWTKSYSGFGIRYIPIEDK